MLDLNILNQQKSKKAKLFTSKSNELFEETSKLNVTFKVFHLKVFNN